MAPSGTKKARPPIRVENLTRGKARATAGALPDEPCIACATIPPRTSADLRPGSSSANAHLKERLGMRRNYLELGGRK